MFADVRALIQNTMEHFGYGLPRAPSEPLLLGSLPSPVFVSREAQIEWNRQFMLSQPRPAPVVQQQVAHQGNLVDFTRQVLPWPWGMYSDSQNPGLPQMAAPVLSPVPARALNLNPEAHEFVPLRERENERRGGYEDADVQANFAAEFAVDGENYISVEGFAGQYWRFYGEGERRDGR